MSDKYIIKNCPAYQTFYSDTTDGSSSTLCTKGFTKLYCQDCTDCVLKCIKSKLDYLKCYINNEDLANLSKMNEIIDSTLKLLDIQEVE